MKHCVAFGSVSSVLAHSSCLLPCQLQGLHKLVIDMSKGKHAFFVPSSDVLVSHCGNQLAPHKAAVKRPAKERPRSQETGKKQDPCRNYKKCLFGHNLAPPPSEVFSPHLPLSWVDLCQQTAAALTQSHLSNYTAKLCPSITSSPEGCSTSGGGAQASAIR